MRGPPSLGRAARIRGPPPGSRASPAPVARAGPDGTGKHPEPKGATCFRTGTDSDGDAHIAVAEREGAPSPTAEGPCAP
ncbi:hypothetical protein GCM10010398_43530 [Streptomyces fimbriatus]